MESEAPPYPLATIGPFDSVVKRLPCCVEGARAKATRSGEASLVRGVDTLGSDMLLLGVI